MDKGRYLVMMAFGLTAFLGAAATGILPCGDFEKGLADWSRGRAGTTWRVEAGAGRPPKPSTPPSAALVWERRSGDKEGSWIGADMPVKPGTVYRITAWAAVDRLSGNHRNPGFSVGIGTTRKFSQWCCGTRLNFGRNEEVDLDGWRKLTNVTPPIPCDADRMVLALSVDGDAVGRVRFDDVVVEPIEEHVVHQFSCLAPGRAASAGPVLFSAKVYPDVLRHPFQTLRPKLKWKGGEKPMTFVRKDFVEADVDATEFAPGTHEVTLSLETASGTVLGTGTVDFTRTEPDAKPRRTAFDAHRRLLVDGKATYPLGIYWHYGNNGDEAAFDLLAYTPFNFVISYDKELRNTDELDRFHRRGIGVVSSLAHAYSWIPYRPSAVTNDASAVRHVERVVSMVRNHPAHWGWYLVDEPTMDKIPTILAQYRRVKALDPGHVAGIVTWTPNDARLLSQCCDFFGVDSYPIGSHAASETEKIFPRLGEITRECVIAREQVKGRVPLWQVPQAFNWAGDYKHDPRYWWMRMPTREEFVSQAWQEIASGADGFCWFIFRDIYGEWKKGNRAPFYDLCSAVEDVRRLAPVLLSVETPPRLSGMDKDLTARAFLHGGRAYVVACNLTWKRRAATLTLEGAWRNPRTEVGAPAGLKDGGKLELDLPPIGVSVIRLEQDSSSH